MRSWRAGWWRRARATSWSEGEREGWGSAPTGQWKLYDVQKVRAPRPLPASAPFPIAPGYTPADKALRTLLAEVPYDLKSKAPPPQSTPKQEP